MDCSLPLRWSFARHVQNAVGVEEEVDGDPGEPGRHGGNPLQLEASEASIVLGQLPFSLEDVNVHRDLPIHIGGKHLLGVGGDRAVPGDENPNGTPHHLDAKGQGGDVEKQHISNPPRQNPRLDGRPKGDDLPRVQLAVRGFAEDFLNGLPNDGGSGSSLPPRSPHRCPQVSARRL